MFFFIYPRSYVCWNKSLCPVEPFHREYAQRGVVSIPKDSAVSQSDVSGWWHIPPCRLRKFNTVHRMLFDGYVMLTAPKGKTGISHRRKSSSTHKISQYSDSVNINEVNVSFLFCCRKETECTQPHLCHFLPPFFSQSANQYHTQWPGLNIYLWQLFIY